MSNSYSSNSTVIMTHSIHAFFGNFLSYSISGGGEVGMEDLDNDPWVKYPDTVALEDPK